MARLARIAFLATLLTVATALTGCGGDNTETMRYVRELTTAQQRFQINQKRLETDAARSRTPSQNRRALMRFGDSIEVTIAALREIAVPSKVTVEHRRFVDVFVTWRDDVARFVAAFRHPTPRSFALARRRIAAATVAFDQSSRAAATRIDAKLGGT